jgi:hypothetical protein
MPTLADIYSAIGSAKRRMSDFVANPVTSAQQMLGYANDRARVLNEMTAAAADEKELYGPASQALGKKLAEGYNPAGIFIGPNASSFNKIAAVKAEKMAKLGKTADEIWEETGSFKGADGIWRQEISDTGMTANDYRNTGGAIVLKHPELRAAYPQLPTGVKIQPEPSFSEMSAYKAPADELAWKLGEGGTIHVPAKEAVPMDVYAHELQHAVQAREGFARGGSPEGVARRFMDYANPEWVEYAKTLPNYKNQPTDKAKQEFIESYVKMRLGHPEDVYMKLGGEAEARAVQKRYYMTEEEKKKTHPFKSYDVPIKNLILQYK